MAQSGSLISTSETWLSIIDKQKLYEQGYLIVDVIPQNAVSQISRDFEQRFFDKVDQSGFHTTMKVEDAEYRKEVDEYIKKSFSGEVSAFLPGYRILFSNFLNKPANSPSAVGIHRDWNYVDETMHASYNLWVPLVDVTEENGGLYVLPGSHSVPHGPRATPFNNALAVYQHPIRVLSQRLSVKAGQGVLYHSGLVHFSEQNASALNRVAVGMVCVPDGATIFHFHKDPTGSGYRRYCVDINFYYNFQPESLPSDQYDFEVISDETGEEPLGYWMQGFAKNAGKTSALVADYYDRTTEGYLQTYGQAIQAFRPKHLKDLYKYLVRSIGLKDGMKILDAGCGVGGPAAFFASRLSVDIIGYTISQTQVDIARDHTKKRWWHKGSAVVRLGDYHHLSSLETPGSFDGVIFLESLGHSSDPERAIIEAYTILKPGGFIYIKDFFPHEVGDPELAKKYAFVINRINTAYAYNVLYLNPLIAALRRNGFEIDYIKKFDFVDDITARAAFEDMFKIDLFGGIDEFRVAEWLEIRCTKPKTI